MKSLLTQWIAPKTFVNGDVYSNKDKLPAVIAGPATKDRRLVAVEKYEVKSKSKPGYLS